VGATCSARGQSGAPPFLPPGWLDGGFFARRVQVPPLQQHDCRQGRAVRIGRRPPAGLCGHLRVVSVAPQPFDPVVPGFVEGDRGGSKLVVTPASRPEGPVFSAWRLCAVQLAPGTAPVVLAEGFWGGAHCCYAPTLYRCSPIAAAYRVVEDLSKSGVGKGLHWNPNAGFQPAKIGSVVVLESSDGAFAYQFGCYACTPAPTRIFTLASGGLVDVTTRYPGVIRAEARLAWDEAAQSMGSASGAGSVEGPLAEWAADQCELGDGVAMWARLAQLQAGGSLAAAEGQSLNNARPFPAQLKSFLVKQGYCAGRL
jgi:hypothetical protein